MHSFFQSGWKNHTCETCTVPLAAAHTWKLKKFLDPLFYGKVGVVNSLGISGGDLEGEELVVESEVRPEVRPEGTRKLP